MPVPSQETERSCIFVIRVSILSLFFDYIMALFLEMWEFFFAVHFINMPVLYVSPVGSNSSYIHLRNVEFAASLHKGNNKITELRTILQRESQNS